MLSLFAPPHVVPDLHEFPSSVEHKRMDFEETLLTKQLMVAIDFHSFFPTVLVNVHQMFVYQNSSK